MINVYSQMFHLTWLTTATTLTLSWRGPLSYRTQSIDLLWFLYDNDLRHERVKCIISVYVTQSKESREVQLDLKLNSFSSIKNQGLIRRRKNKLEKKWSHQNGKLWQSLSEKCTYSEFFWFIFPLWTEYGEILQVCPYLVRMPENADQK